MLQTAAANSGGKSKNLQCTAFYTVMKSKGKIIIYSESFTLITRSVKMRDMNRGASADVAVVKLQRFG